MRHFFTTTSVFLLSAGMTLAQSAPVRPEQKADEEIARIVGYAMTRGGASAFLETLTDTVGGRITGSPESQATAELILKALKEAGLDNAHFEEYELGSLWRHGRATGEVISPVHRSLYIGSYGWGPGAPGPIEVPVVGFRAVGPGRFALPGEGQGAAGFLRPPSN